MYRTFARLLAATVLAAALFAPVAARAGSDVSVALTAQRITLTNGKEMLSSAAQVKPGEIVEYRATYTNSGTEAARQMMATLPVPAGMEFVGRTATPSKLEASLDGRTWASVPLTRRVKQADGRMAVKEVPTSEYRFLRWPIGTLAAKSARTVSARMRVQSVPVAAAVR